MKSARSGGGRNGWSFWSGRAGSQADYVHASGRKVEDVMSTEPLTVGEDDSLETVVELMERRHVKRLPVLRDGKMVGIVSRANLMYALASLARDAQADKRAPAGDDAAIRERIQATLAKQPWAPQVNVVVNRGIAELWGTITDERERQALIVATENVAGVSAVRDHLVWVEPMSGMAFGSPEDESQGARGATGAELRPLNSGAALFLHRGASRGATIMHRQKRNALPRTLAAAAIAAAALLPLSARAQSTLSPSEQRGFVFVRTNCARCHAVDKVSPSPLKVAPPFRTLHTRYPVESLQELLAEGIVTGHPTMPEFQLDPGQVDDVIAYLKSLER